MRALEKGHKATVKTLLEVGANPNLGCPDGLTSLMYAAQKTIVENAALLVDHGANPRLKDRQGLTALDHALAAKRAKGVALLTSDLQ